MTHKHRFLLGLPRRFASGLTAGLVLAAVCWMLFRDALALVALAVELAAAGMVVAVSAWRGSSCRRCVRDVAERRSRREVRLDGQLDP